MNINNYLDFASAVEKFPIHHARSAEQIEFERKVLSSVGSSLAQKCPEKMPAISSFQGKGPHSTETRDKVEQMINRAAKDTESRFGDTTNNFDSLCTRTDFSQCLEDKLVEICTVMLSDLAKLPPKTIAECGVNEAIFSHAQDWQPILATDGLATCIGIAGYSTEQRSGFLFHIATEDDLKASQDELIENIQKMSRGSPVELHLRGGYEGVKASEGLPSQALWANVRLSSQPLLDKIEEWIRYAAEKGCPMTIKSSDVLKSGGSMSLALDTTTGVVTNYDASTNFYAEPKTNMDTADEEERTRCIDTLFAKILQSSTNPGIKVVYSALNLSQ